jgi:hypothetical protein
MTKSFDFIGNEEKRPAGVAVAPWRHFPKREAVQAIQPAGRSI